MKTNATKLIEHLAAFNRKERFILLNEALGAFALSSEFREALRQCLKLEFEIPAGAYVAMDYHIGWIQMAIHLCNAQAKDDPYISASEVQGVNDNQQDVDLLVAFTRDSVSHLVLIEAKADTDWDYEQLSSKVNRLSKRLAESPSLKLYFVLLSPKDIGKSKYVNVGNWPAWMKGANGGHNYMPLTLSRHLRKITRCSEGGKASASGTHYRIDPLK